MRHRRVTGSHEWAEIDRAWKRQQRHRWACWFGDRYEDAKQLTAVVVFPVVCLGVLALALFLISEAGTRWLAVPVGLGVLVVAYVAWRLARRRGGERHG